MNFYSECKLCGGMITPENVGDHICNSPTLDTTTLDAIILDLERLQGDGLRRRDAEKLISKCFLALAKEVKEIKESLK